MTDIDGLNVWRAPIGSLQVRMHIHAKPQRHREPTRSVRRFLLVAGMLFPLAATAALSETQRSALVRTSVIENRDLSQRLVVFGRIAPDPDTEQSISTPRAGLIAATFVRLGEAISEGAPLFELDTSPVSVALSQQAEAAVTYERQRLKRLQPLVTRGLVRAEAVAAAERGVADAEAQLAQVRAQGGNIPKEVVRAPASGIVTKVLASSGDRVQADTIVMKVASRKSMIAALGIEPEDVENLPPLAPVKIRSVWRSTININAKVDKLNAMINPATGLVDAVVKLTPPATERLIIGTPVTATLTVSAFKGLVAPREAIMRDDAGAFVFIVKDGKVFRRTIRVLFEQDEFTALAGDVAAGDHAVVMGAAGLHDGEAVREAIGK